MTDQTPKLEIPQPLDDQASDADCIAWYKTHMKALFSHVCEQHFKDNYEGYVRLAAAHLKDKGIVRETPHAAIVLGSGLGGLVNAMTNTASIDFNDVPGMPPSTVDGHSGVIHSGEIEGVRVLGFQGRIHAYEHLPHENALLRATFGVHLAAELGAKTYIPTNAAGGVDHRYNVADMMIADTELGLFFPNALQGRLHDFDRVDGMGKQWRFQPLANEYTPALRHMMMAAAHLADPLHAGEWLREGTLGAVTGPTYESKGDVLALRKLGVAAIGMSTIPEVRVACARGMHVMGLTCISNAIDEEGNNKADHAEVKAVLESDQVAQRYKDTLTHFFRMYGTTYAGPHTALK